MADQAVLDRTDPPAAAPAEPAPPTQPDAAAAEPSVSHAPDPGAAPEGSAPATKDWKQALEAGELPIDDILKHPDVAGKVGRLAQQQASAEATRMLADEQRKAREAELGRIAQQRLQEDPNDLLAKQHLEVAQAANAETVRSWLVDYLGPEGAKEYNESPDFANVRGQSVDPVSFLKALAPLRDKHALAALLATERAKWEKEERPALRKEILAELNGGEPSLETGGGTAAAGSLTYERYLAMSSEDRRKLPPKEIDDMNARLARGGSN